MHKYYINLHYLFIYAMHKIMLEEIKYVENVNDITIQTVWVKKMWGITHKWCDKIIISVLIQFWNAQKSG